MEEGGSLRAEGAEWGELEDGALWRGAKAGGEGVGELATRGELEAASDRGRRRGPRRSVAAARGELEADGRERAAACIAGRERLGRGGGRTLTTITPPRPYCFLSDSSHPARELYSSQLTSSIGGWLGDDFDVASGDDLDFWPLVLAPIPHTRPASRNQPEEVATTIHGRLEDGSPWRTTTLERGRGGRGQSSSPPTSPAPAGGGRGWRGGRRGSRLQIRRRLPPQPLLSPDGAFLQGELKRETRCKRDRERKGRASSSAKREGELVAIAISQSLRSEGEEVNHGGAIEEPQRKGRAGSRVESVADKAVGNDRTTARREATSEAQAHSSGEASSSGRSPPAYACPSSRLHAPSLPRAPLSLPLGYSAARCHRRYRLAARPRTAAVACRLAACPPPTPPPPFGCSAARHRHYLAAWPRAVAVACRLAACLRAHATAALLLASCTAFGPDATTPPVMAGTWECRKQRKKGKSVILLWCWYCGMRK
ncbi:hypothetical protein PR202_gb17029 [Eleusine coracana subsp. coracana]|uniref:Uncharacterized protein n=1 Tax=Eleusine coracana subsp. coracana TaxID=191504 RepID=A0AAV5F1X6_ELECO|nr:hypothetical protein PR202_gb17029 [Eleusine coracana subsp. coracana]